MNYESIRYIIGWILKVEAILMLLPLAAAAIYQEHSGWAFVISSIICMIIGVLLARKKPTNTAYYAKEGYVSVSLGWLVMSFMGALPFVISGEIPSFVDAWFEIVSGFTTTGASILVDVESLPKSLILWRSFSQWIGGMGVLVFILAILPLAGGEHNFQLMKVETPGPMVSKLVPRLRHTAVMLYKIYFTMTLVMFVLLLVGGLNIFDSLCIAFGTAGTGGFGIMNSSMADYNMFLQGVTLVFMLLFGVNFSFYFLILYRKVKEAFSLEEVRWYFIIYFISVFALTFDLTRHGEVIFEAFHDAAFHAASMITTTAYSTDDFNVWPALSKGILFVLMFIGSCAGSTGGGMKVSRIIVYLKSVRKEIRSLVHPRSVRAIKLDGKVVEDAKVRTITAYLAAYLMIFAFTLLVISRDDYDFETNFLAVAATINNIGPGFGSVGPLSNFSGFSDLSKIIMSIVMLTGRLEIFPILILFAPSTWKNK